MTYPPQQQPDPWGQGDQWGQQPPPPQDPWGGGYDGYGPPPKKGGGKTVAIVLVVLLVLAGAGVGLYFWLKNKDDDQAGPGGLNQNDPKSVAVAWADLYAKAYNSDFQEVRVDKLKPLMCQSQHKDLDEEQQLADASHKGTSSSSAAPTPRHRKYKLTVGDVKTNGDAATVMVTATPEAQSSGSARNGPQPKATPFVMKKENGGWKVCGPQRSGDGGQTPAPGSGGESSMPVPTGSLQPLPSGIPLPTH